MTTLTFIGGCGGTPRHTRSSSLQSMAEFIQREGVEESKVTFRGGEACIGMTGFAAARGVAGRRPAIDEQEASETGAHAGAAPAARTGNEPGDSEHARDAPVGTASALGGHNVDAAVLHREHFLHLARLAAMLVGDRETAEDLVQDVFATMHAKWHRFAGSGPERIVRYLRAAVLNRARSALRHRAVVTSHQPDRPADEPSAEHHAVDRLQGRGVREAVAELPTRQREVVLLRYLEDLSIAETARVLRVSKSAVTSSAERALAALKTALDDQWGAQQP